MRRGKRLRCIFILPVLLLLAYLGAALSNVLPVEREERRLPEQSPGADWADVTVGSGYVPDNVFAEPEGIDFPVRRILYQGLSEKEREAYRALYGAVLEHRETVYIPTLSAAELGNVHAALKYDNPHLPCISDAFSYGSIGGLCYVRMQYDYTEAECEALRAALVSAARSVCESCAGEDEYDRELFLHDALVRIAEYSDEADTANTAVGTLLKGKGVCAGYALGMKLMCDISGIESCIVRGTAVSETGAEAHAWLVVRIGGNWYHVDPTWDDPVNERSADQLTHAYFNLPTDWISADHMDFTLPEGIACDSTEDNYYVRAGLYCGADDWQEAVAAQLADRLPELPAEVELRFADAGQFDEAYADLMDGAINRLMNELIRGGGYPIERWRVSVQTFNSMNCLHLIISEDND